jgi:dienelactone hydrolase
MLRRCFLTTLLSAPAWQLPARPSSGDLRNRKLAHPETHFQLRPYETRTAWDQRRNHLRKQILSAAGLFPLPDRNPRPHPVRQTRHTGYTTEVLLLETLPGYLIGCTVYRPLEGTARSPAVLIPHGHWDDGRIEHLPSYSVPALGINLALQGYVAVSWDMVGYNDANQTDHSFGGWREQLWAFNPLALELWNSISVLEYVLSRPDVDVNRVACTGASGGATQTILLCAVDDRITCSAPVNMISAHYQGADPCEEAPNLRLDTNNVEIAALMAPRPMLVVSCTGDWTRNTPREEFPFLQSIYDLYGREALVRNAHFDAEHNYDARTREAVYAFLSKHMLRRPHARPKDVEVGKIDTDDLIAYSKGVESPVERVDYTGLLSQWISLGKPAARDGLRYALAAEWPDNVIATGSGKDLILYRDRFDDRIPALWFPGEGAPVVIVHHDGKKAAIESEQFRALSNARRPVLAIDAFQTGEARERRDRGGRWFLSYNQTDDANRVQDILTALSYVNQTAGERSSLVGLDKAAIWCTFAAAIAPVPVALQADLGDFTGTDEQMRRDFFVPCIQRAGGLKVALTVLGML